MKKALIYLNVRVGRHIPRVGGFIMNDAYGKFILTGHPIELEKFNELAANSINAPDGTFQYPLGVEIIDVPESGELSKTEFDTIALEGFNAMKLASETGEAFSDPYPAGSQESVALNRGADDFRAEIARQNEDARRLEQEKIAAEDAKRIEDARLAEEQRKREEQERIDREDEENLRKSKAAEEADGGSAEDLLQDRGPADELDTDTTNAPEEQTEEPQQEEQTSEKPKEETYRYEGRKIIRESDGKHVAGLFDPGDHMRLASKDFKEERENIAAWVKTNPLPQA